MKDRKGSFEIHLADVKGEQEDVTIQVHVRVLSAKEELIVALSKKNRTYLTK